jgi:hypothetical protein
LQKVPRTKQTLAKRLQTLRTLVKQSASEYQLLKAACKLRDAQIQVLRARIGEMPIETLRTPSEDRQIARMLRQIEQLIAVTPRELLMRYVRRPDSV